MDTETRSESGPRSVTITVTPIVWNNQFGASPLFSRYMPAKAKCTPGSPPRRFRYPIVTVTGQRQLRYTQNFFFGRLTMTAMANAALSLYVQQRVTPNRHVFTPLQGPGQNPNGMQQVITRMPDRAISG